MVFRIWIWPEICLFHVDCWGMQFRVSWIINIDMHIQK